MVKLLIVVALILGLAAAKQAWEQRPALCGTDTECLALCPAKDETCDGGPQS